jgi:hypothetical protein
MKGAEEVGSNRRRRNTRGVGKASTLSIDRPCNMKPIKTTTLYRPVGPQELELVRRTGWKAFPPRLPEQPIFYPVLNEEYATQIARDWNVKESGTGFVTRLQVRSEFISKYPVRQVGASTHKEYWIPADELAEFNNNIVGQIEVIAEFGKSEDESGRPHRTA